MIWALVVLTAFTVVFAWLWRGVLRDLASDDPYTANMTQTHMAILTVPTAILLLLWGIAIWRVLT